MKLKTLSLILSAFAIMAVMALFSHAQTAGVPVLSAPVASGNGLVAFLKANWGAVIAPLLVAVADLLFAVNPAWKSNGLAHWVYLQLGGKETPAV